MKANNSEMKKLNRFVYPSYESLETRNYPEHVLPLQKIVKYDKKSNIISLFFCEKPVSKTVKS